MKTDVNCILKIGLLLLSSSGRDINKNWKKHYSIYKNCRLQKNLNLFQFLIILNISNLI
jgi:hypothetical protein